MMALVDILTMVTAVNPVLSSVSVQNAMKRFSEGDQHAYRTFVIVVNIPAGSASLVRWRKTD